MLYVYIYYKKIFYFSSIIIKKISGQKEISPLLFIITVYIFIKYFNDSKTNYDSYLQNFGGGSVALNSVVAAAAVVDYTKT